MKELLHKTAAYKTAVADEKSGAQPQSVLAVFPDAKYLRELLKEYAKAFFAFEEGSRGAKLIDDEGYLDCVMLPEKGKKLTVKDAEKAVEESFLRPFEGDKKLIVLDRFHEASPVVQNKLLKTLEEPPKGVYLLLGAAREDPLLPTVKSRVKSIVDNPFSEEDIFTELKKHYPEGDCHKAAAACGGIYSTAETLLSDGGGVFSLAKEFLTLENSEEFCRKAADYPDKEGFLSALSLYIRDMLFLLRGAREYVSLADAKELTPLYTEGALLSAAEFVREAEEQLQFHANFSQLLYALSLKTRKERDKWQKLS